MTTADVLLVLAGAVLMGAGLWWLGVGRWTWIPESRFQRGIPFPTRVVVALVHLVLGYHLVVWSIPGDHRPLQMSRAQWPWLVLGCAAAVGGSRLMDRWEQRGDDGDGASD